MLLSFCFLLEVFLFCGVCSFLHSFSLLFYNPTKFALPQGATMRESIRKNERKPNVDFFAFSSFPVSAHQHPSIRYSRMNSILYFFSLNYLNNQYFECATKTLRVEWRIHAEWRANIYLNRKHELSRMLGERRWIWVWEEMEVLWPICCLTLIFSWLEADEEFSRFAFVVINCFGTFTTTRCRNEKIVVSFDQRRCLDLVILSALCSPQDKI